MISRKFLKSSVIYTLVGSLPYATGFLLLPWFTQYLTPAQFGINALYISIMYLVQIIAPLGMDLSTVILQYDFNDTKENLSRFLGTIFLLILVSGGFALIFFCAGGFRALTALFDSQNYLVLVPFGIITVISAIFNSIFKTYSALLIYQEHPERFFWLNISNFVITLAASLTLLYMYPFTLTGPIIGRMIPAVISAGISLVLLSGEYRLGFDKSLIRMILKVSFPLLLYALMTWTISYIDRFILLGLMKDPVKVGIYDFSVKLVLFLDLMLTGLVNTINPKVYSIWKEGGHTTSTPEVNRFYSGLTAFFLVIIPLFVLIAPFVVPLFIFKPVYYESFSFIAVLSAGFITRVWFFMYLAPLMFFKKTHALPKVFLFSAAFEIGAGLLMVRYFGLEGAVWTFFLVKPVQAFFLWTESRKVFTFRFNKTKIMVLPAIYLAVVVASSFFTQPSNRVYFAAGQVLLCLVLVWAAYRREAVPLLRQFLRR